MNTLLSLSNYLIVVTIVCIASCRGDKNGEDRYQGRGKIGFQASTLSNVNEADDKQTEVSKSSDASSDSTSSNATTTKTESDSESKKETKETTNEKTSEAETKTTPTPTPTPTPEATVAPTSTDETNVTCNSYYSEVDGANSGNLTDAQGNSLYYYLVSKGKDCSYQLRAKVNGNEREILVEGLDDILDDGVKDLVAFGFSPVLNPTYTYSYQYVSSIECVWGPVPLCRDIYSTGYATANTAASNYRILYMFTLLDKYGHVQAGIYIDGAWKKMKDLGEEAGVDLKWDSINGIESTAVGIKVLGRMTINGKKQIVSYYISFLADASITSRIGY